MEAKTLENVNDATINLAHLSHQISKAKVLVDDVLEDGKRKIERTAKRSFNAAEECVENTTYFIKRHPWESVGISVGVGAVGGLLTGLLTGWLIARPRRVKKEVNT